ncbi:hypothetical protein, partial [Synechococcus sp. BSA11S]|uniref:hypothetical protein n=1 Tax=Synechococcus sp. BSA11S TaxID=2599077 RepID=UPI001C898ED5
MVDAHNLWLAPVTDVTTPALRILLPSFFVGLLTDGTDPNGLAVVPLIGRHILDAAMPVLSVVPADKA